MKSKLAILALLAMQLSSDAQFTFTTNNGSITITGYNIAAGFNVVIPASTNGYLVTSIGDSAFYYKTTITNVTMPSSITSIGAAAFYNCYGLTLGGDSTAGKILLRYCTFLRPGHRAGKPA